MYGGKPRTFIVNYDANGHVVGQSLSSGSPGVAEPTTGALTPNGDLAVSIQTGPAAAQFTVKQTGETVGSTKQWLGGATGTSTRTLNANHDQTAATFNAQGVAGTLATPTNTYGQVSGTVSSTYGGLVYAPGITPPKVTAQCLPAPTVPVSPHVHQVVVMKCNAASQTLSHEVCQVRLDGSRTCDPPIVDAVPRVPNMFGQQLGKSGKCEGLVAGQFYPGSDIKPYFTCVDATVTAMNTYMHPLNRYPVYPTTCVDANTMYVHDGPFPPYPGPDLPVSMVACTPYDPEGGLPGVKGLNLATGWTVEGAYGLQWKFAGTTETWDPAQMKRVTHESPQVSAC